jgi:hypothetical protein
MPGVEGVYDKRVIYPNDEGADSILTQAYNHLKTTEYYKDAQEV